MSYRDEVPSPVIEAAQVKIDLPVTAILYLPEIEGFSLVGNIFNDSRGQFADATHSDVYCRRVFGMFGLHHRFDIFGESLRARFGEWN